MVASKYAYLKLQAIEHLNRSLCSPGVGKLGAAQMCAITFLLWAEVRLRSRVFFPIWVDKICTDSGLHNSGTAETIGTFMHISPA